MNPRGLLAATVFGLIQIVLFPLALVAYVLFVFKLIRYSRRSGASATVLASFYARWMQHQLGTRPDEPCARLMLVLPNVSPLGLRLVSGPTLLAHRLTGYVPRVYRYPYAGVPPMRDQPAARTTFFDAALQRHLAGIDQLVVLGAGLDTRAYRLPAGTRLRCFEVDTPKTQSFKREMLKQAGVDSSRVTYVPANFEHEDWLEKLVEAGFEADRPSFFLWEAVTMYLDRAAVESTLRKIATTAKGSVVAFDYFSTELIDNRSLFWRYARAVVKAVGEPFGSFGLETTPPARQHVAAFLASCGLTLEEQRTFGQESDRKHALAGFAAAIPHGMVPAERAARGTARVSRARTRDTPESSKNATPGRAGRAGGPAAGHTRGVDPSPRGGYDRIGCRGSHRSAGRAEPTLSS